MVLIDYPQGHGLMEWGGSHMLIGSPSASASGGREQVLDVSPALAMEQSTETILKKLARQAGLTQAPKPE